MSQVITESTFPLSNFNKHISHIKKYMQMYFISRYLMKYSLNDYYNKFIPDDDVIGRVFPT